MSNVHGTHIELDDCWNRIGVWSIGVARCEKLAQHIHCQNCPVYARIGKQLLEREMPSTYLDECTQTLAETKEAPDHNLTSAIIFKVGDEYYALSTLIFSEITSMRPVHTIPHRKNRVLRGLINIRGELLLCFSLGSLFELTRGEEEEHHEFHSGSRLLIIKHENNRYAFPVSEVRGIYKYNPDALTSKPSTLSENDSSYIKGVFEIEQLHVGCLDEKLLISALDRMIT